MRTGSLLLLALMVASSRAEERRTADVELQEVSSVEVQPRLLFPRLPAELAPLGKGDAQGSGDRTPAARSVSVTLAGRKVQITLDRPQGANALGMAWCGGEGPFFGRARDLGADGLAIDFEGIRSVAGTINLRLRYHPGDEAPTVRVEPGTQRRGRAVIAGQIREVILVDADQDGRFDGPKDRWIALRIERLAKTKTLRQAEALLLSEPQIPFESDGRAFMVEKVDAAGKRLTLVLDAPTLDFAAVLARRYAEVRREYFEDFADEGASFAKRTGLDRSRPRAAEAVAWSRGTLTDAKAAAAAARKPLLAFYFVESNPSCYRYDYYTFPDREVDDLLRKFHLVLIDAEKDQEHSFQQGNRTLLPCLVPFSPKGEPVKFPMRVREEGGTVKDLDRPETAIAGWQRPQELAENLRRILVAAR